MDEHWQQRAIRRPCHVPSDRSDQVGQGVTQNAGPDGNDSLKSGAYPAPAMPVGGLIGRVNNSGPFPIGSNTRPIRMPADGTLLLGINDNELGDNSGFFSVGSPPVAATRDHHAGAPGGDRRRSGRTGGNGVGYSMGHLERGGGRDRDTTRRGSTLLRRSVEPVRPLAILKGAAAAHAVRDWLVWLGRRRAKQNARLPADCSEQYKLSGSQEPSSSRRREPL